jgi:hypothetical protein
MEGLRTLTEDNGQPVSILYTCKSNRMSYDNARHVCKMLNRNERRRSRTCSVTREVSGGAAGRRAAHAGLVVAASEAAALMQWQVFKELS